MPEPVESKPPSSIQEMFRTSPVLSVLALIAFINWFVFSGISAHFGGEAIGIVPSFEGFVVTSHGSKTGVTESVWLFSLIYPYCTLMLTPAVFFLYGSRFKFLRSAPALVRWLVRAFLCVWVIGWYGFITEAFVRSVNDYQSLRHRNHSVQPTAPRRAGNDG